MFRPISASSIMTGKSDAMAATAQTEVAWVDCKIDDKDNETASPQRSDLPRTMA